MAGLPAATRFDGRCYHHAHTPPLLGRKPSSAKSRVSITSKLIEIKGFQLQYFGHLRKTGGRGSYRLVHTTHDLVRKSPPLTRAFPTLARPLPNLPIFNIFPSIGGRVPPGPTNSSELLASPTRSTRSNHMHRTPTLACPELAEVAFPQLAEVACPERSRRVTGLPAEASAKEGHCAPAPMVGESPHCCTWKHPAAPRCLIPRADKGWGITQDAAAQPSSASKPQVALRRWGRKADRVRLGQRTFVG